MFAPGSPPSGPLSMSVSVPSAAFICSRGAASGRQALKPARQSVRLGGAQGCQPGSGAWQSLAPARSRRPVFWISRLLTAPLAAGVISFSRRRARRSSGVAARARSLSSARARYFPLFHCRSGVAARATSQSNSAVGPQPLLGFQLQDALGIIHKLRDLGLERDNQQ
ncbi:unnamed protein product [Polarella glacialis]|uniref:Uncharacterized protein n=1 Tax=Polarella glacialis TaxID=89957 RepID=A0A813HHB7_POLGL|nr:unnamed protein product [Polarella glacialis]